MTYVDSVSVIMGMGPRTLLHVLASTPGGLQALGTPEYSKCMPYHRITAQRASKVLSSVS